jgi:anionic cell wall polymer biosynthesis LytR-Cps2A-Psr (LCP) family protein
MKKILIIVSGVLLAFGLAYFLNIFKVDSKSIAPAETPKPVQTTFNFLLLGYGGGAHEGTYLTDTMMVAHVDIKSKKATLISIPRDLWVMLPTKSDEEFHRKINAVYQIELFPQNYPGLDKRYLGTDEDAKLVKTIVSQVTGFKIDGYISVNFEGFTKAIDILGGIDVEIARSFTDDEYPITGKETDLCGQDELFKKAEPFLSPTATESGSREDKFREDPKIEEFVKNATSSPYLAFPCRYEKLEFTKGVTHLDGKTALKYARTRHSAQDGGDFNRAHRQQQIIEAVKNKVLSLGFVSKIIPLMDQFKQDVKTDIGLDIIRKFIGEADNMGQYKSTSYVISDENVLKNAISSDKQYILIPKEGEDNWSGIHKELNNLIEGITPTPDASPSASLN